MPPREPSPDALAAAAHEIGHYLVAHAFGITVNRVWIKKGFGGHKGQTERDPSLDLEAPGCPPRLVRASLIGDVAGFEAEELWCGEHGGHADPDGSKTDYENFRAFNTIKMSMAVAKAEARSIVRRNWARVERLTARLALNGSFRP